MAEELPGLGDVWNDNDTGVNELTLAFSRLSAEIDELQHKSEMSADDTKRLNDLSEDFIKVLRDLGVVTKDVTTSTGGYKHALTGVISTIMSLSDASRVATNTMSGLGSALRMLGGGMGALGTFIGLLGKSVEVYDKVIVAQRELVGASLQSGIAYGDQRKQIEATSLAVRKAANEWGYLREEAAKFTGTMTAQGLGARSGDTASERASRLGRDLPNALQASIQAQRAYGLSIDQTTRLMTLLGTTQELEGTRFQEVMGSMTEVGSKSALGLNRYLDTIMQLTESTKVYGRNLAGVSLFTGMFGDQLKKGTISMDNLVKIIAPASMDRGHMAAIASMIQRQSPQLSKDLGIEGMSPLAAVTQIQDRISSISEKKELDASDMRSLDAIRKGIALAIPEGRTGPEGAQLSQMMLEKFSISISKASVAQEFLFGSQKEMADIFLEINKDQKGAAKNLKSAAEEFYSKYKTIDEMFVPAGASFRDIIIESGNQFKSIVTFGMSDNNDLLGGLSGVAEERALPGASESERYRREDVGTYMKTYGVNRETATRAIKNRGPSARESDSDKKMNYLESNITSPKMMMANMMGLNSVIKGNEGSGINISMNMPINIGSAPDLAEIEKTLRGEVTEKMVFSVMKELKSEMYRGNYSS